MQASTLRILEAANFPTSQAVALGHAIEEELKAAQPVTLPIFEVRMVAIDAQFAAFRSEFKADLARLESRLTNKMFAFGLVLLGAIASLYFKR